MRTILLLMVNPIGTQQLRLDEEVKRIEEGVNRSKNRDQFRLVSKWAVTDDDLRRALLDYEPEIVHFAGHGLGNGLAGFTGSGIGGLAFEDDQGRVQLISGEALARQFELHSEYVKCVVMNACYSEIQADLIVRQIDVVIGMNQAIGDAAALKFAVGFYDAIAAGRSYQYAFKFGCSAIDLKGIPEHLTPVLKERNSVGVKPGSPTTPMPSHPTGGQVRGIEPTTKTTVWDPDPLILRKAQRKLARFVGPMAEFLVRDAARQARGLEEFQEILANKIPTEKDRSEFLESRLT